MKYTIQYNDFGNPCAVLKDDEIGIPLDTGNTYFQDFLKWNEQQAIPLNWRTPIVISKTWDEIKAHRNILLSSCDWTQIPDAVLTVEEKTAWQDYRQLLRDIPQDYLTPDDAIFPTPPNEVI